MRDNKLIEALPPTPSDEDLVSGLALLPDFAIEQRSWENHERIQQIKGLSNCLIPLDNHLDLARLIDTNLREGYVSRPLRSAKLQKQLQDLYYMQKEGKRFSQLSQAVGAQDSVALIGMPGMGKSTTVKRSFARYPLVIDHGDGVLQIPYIHVDLSSNGTSVKALAVAIISWIDRLLPDCDYAGLYLSNIKATSTEASIYAAARLIAIHHVGVIVADELQNLSPVKGVQTVMTELVTMCNTLNVPLIFIGTYKANKILGADFRSARRGVGGLAAWGPLPRYDSGVLVPRGADEASQWGEFLRILWQFQWVKHPIELTEDLIDHLHDRTQGVIDLLIKLFAIAQVRAITSGVETVTKEALDEVYEANFGLVHGALDAMRSRQAEAMQKFADVGVLDLETEIQKCEAGARLVSQRGRQAMRPGQQGFTETVAALLVHGGIEPELALRSAEDAGNSKKAEAPLEAVARIVKELRPKRSTKAPKGVDSAEVLYPDFGVRSGDYRRAVALAAQHKTGIAHQLRDLGMLQDAEELVPVL